MFLVTNIQEIFSLKKKKKKNSPQNDSKFLKLHNFWCELISKTALKNKIWVPLVVLWLRVHLAMQETRVQSRVCEESTCLRATKPMRHHSESTSPRDPSTAREAAQ